MHPTVAAALISFVLMSAFMILSLALVLAP
jgi:hypothetical protein